MHMALNFMKCLKGLLLCRPSIGHLVRVNPIVIFVLFPCHVDEYLVTTYQNQTLKELP